MTGLGGDKRVWLGGGAVLAVLIMVAGWFLVIHPELSAASSNRDQAASADQQNQVLQKRNDDLQEKDNDKGALQAGLSAALAQLPSDGALPAFTRQLSAQATAAGVVLTSVIVGAATPLVAAGAASPTTAAAADPSATGTAAAAPATATGLVQMTITVNATGLGRRDLAFLRAIQWTGPRRALVSAVQLAPAAGDSKAGINGQCTLTMTLTIFSAPLSPSAQADLVKLLSGK
jgi:hypothetical protein